MKMKNFLLVAISMALVFAFFACTDDSNSSDDCDNINCSADITGDGLTKETAFQIPGVGSYPDFTLGEDPVWFKVTGTGSVMSFSTAGAEDDFDLYMDVYGDDGSYLKYGDDEYGADTYSRNPKVVLPTKSGTAYYIKISKFSSDNEGPFAFVVGTVTHQNVTIGNKVQSTLNPGGEKWFRVVGNGEIIALGATSPNINLFVEIYSPNGNVDEEVNIYENIADAFDYPTTNGTAYFVRIEEWYGSSGGPFTFYAANYGYCHDRDNDCWWGNSYNCDDWEGEIVGKTVDSCPAGSNIFGH